MESTSNNNTSSHASFEPPTLTSLPKPLLLQIMSLLHAPSLKHLRLTNKLLKDTSDDLVTCIYYGIAPECCSPLQLQRAAGRWPSIKTIKIFFPLLPYQSYETHFEGIFEALECLSRAKWTAVEELEFPEDKSFKLGTSSMNRSGAHCWQALAACTVSWEQLRKLNLQNKACPQGIDVLATHGKFPSLEELDLSFSHYLSSNRTLAGGALAKLVSRAPKLCNLKLRCCHLGDILIPLFEVELPNLEIINLAYADIDDNMLSKLNPQKWPGLSSLVLEGNESVSANGLETLLQKNWTALKHLDVSCADVDNEGIIECLIAASLAGRLPSLTSLGVVDFFGTCFKTFTLAFWSKLERLVIGGRYFGILEINDFVASIQADRFPALRSLTLQELNFQSKKDDWRNILRITLWKHLEELTLECRLAPQNLADLAAVAGNSFPKLRVLTFKGPDDIEGYDSDDEDIWNQAIETLVHAPWPSLRRVEFKYINYSGPRKNLGGWKVTEIDRENRTVMARI